MSIFFSLDLLGQSTPFFEYLPTSYSLNNVELSIKSKIATDTNFTTNYILKINAIEDYLIGEKLSVHFPGYNNPITFKADYVISDSPSNYYWIGYTLDGSSIQLSKNHLGTIGSAYIAQDSSSFAIHILSPTLSILAQRKYSNREGGCSSDSEVEDSINYEDIVTDRSDCHEKRIRILFLFTTAATTNNPENMQALGDLVINQLNESSLASGLKPSEISFESVTPARLIQGFTEKGTAAETSRKLRKFGPARDLRDQFKADIVCLFCDNVWTNNWPTRDASGHGFNNASEDKAYACSQVNKVSDYFKMAHGVGHVIGADHQLCLNCCDIRCKRDCEEPPLRTSNCFDTFFPFTPQFFYSQNCPSDHGWSLQAIPYRTIMTDCDGKERFARWSAPDIPFWGYATGGVDSDNAKELRLNAKRVGCFRVGDLTPPPCLDIEIVGSNYICYTGSKLYSLKDFLGIVNWYTSPNGIDYDFVGVGSTMLITANEPSMFLYIKIESTSGSFCGKRQISVPECLDDPQTEERDGNMITNSSDFNFVSIFPNPTNSSLSISGLLDSQSILLYDISGHLITSKTGDFGDHLDLSNLPKGFYFLKVSGLKNQNVFKIIKE